MKWLMGLMIACTLYSQTTLPKSWYGIGAAYNQSAASSIQKVSGWGAYGYLLDQKVQAYSFSQYNAYIIKGGKVTTAVSTGIAILLRQIGPISVFAFGSAGIATSGVSTGNAFPYGGLVDLKIGKTEWHLDGGYQMIPSSVNGAETQGIVIFGGGRTF